MSKNDYLIHIFHLELMISHHEISIKLLNNFDVIIIPLDY